MESEHMLLLIPKAKQPGFPPSIDIVSEVADLYVQLLESEDPKTILEIETKIGYKATNPKIQSNKGFDVLNCKTPYKEYIELEKFKLHKKNNKLEKKNLGQEEFDGMENFFKYKVQEQPDKFKEAPLEFSVDLSIIENMKGQKGPELNTRASYFPKDKSWIRIEKGDKTTLDILDESLAYRITFAYERPKEFLEMELDFQKVKFLRIKNRRTYIFGDLEYCFTTIAEINKEQKDENTETLGYYTRFAEEFKFCDDKASFLTEIFIEMGIKGLYQYEIEVEYKNLDPLKKNRKTKEVFKPLLEQFLMNTKLLSKISGEYLKTMKSKYGVDFEKIVGGKQASGKIVTEEP